MFKRLFQNHSSTSTLSPNSQNTSIPKEAYKFQSANELLQPYTRYLRNIRLDVGATRDFHDRYYLPVIYRYVEVMQLRPHGHEGEHARKGGAIDATIKRVAITLKLRLGCLLPLNAQAEEIATRKERWTYGVYVSALLREMAGQLRNTSIYALDKQGNTQDEWDGLVQPLKKYYKMSLNPNVTRTFSQTATIALMHYIIPKHGLEWLYEDIELIDCVLDTLAGAKRIDKNPIYDLCVKGSTSIKEADLIFSPVETGEEIKIRIKDNISNLRKLISQTQASLSNLNEELQEAEKAAGAAAQAPKSQIITINDESENHSPSILDLPEPPADHGESLVTHHLEQAPDHALLPVNLTTEQNLVLEHVSTLVPELNSTDAANLVPVLKTLITSQSIDAQLAFLTESNLPALVYPAGFKLFTDSPNTLLNDLRRLGRVVSENQRANQRAKIIILSDH